jgi:HAD superfamily hydrolase (TIGR01509 family)
MQKTPYFSDSQLEVLLSGSEVVILDMNGLIFDDEGVHLKAFNAALESYDISINEDYWIKNCVGYTPTENFEKILKENKQSYQQDDITRLVEAFQNARQQSMQKVIDSVRPGVIKFIDYISNNSKYKLALATSATEEIVEQLLGKNGLDIKSKFNFIVTCEDVTRGKPDPEVYQKISKQYNVEPAKCIVFEDSQIGVEAADNAGMICVTVPNRFTQTQDFGKATHVIDNLTRDAQIKRPHH